MNGIVDAVSGLAPQVGFVSIQACVMALGIALLLLAAGKRVAPRWRCALWTLVVVRLLLPWAPASAVSVYNLLPMGHPAATATAETTAAGEQAPMNARESAAPAPVMKTVSQPLAEVEGRAVTTGKTRDRAAEAAGTPGTVAATDHAAPIEAPQEGNAASASSHGPVTSAASATVQSENAASPKAAPSPKDTQLSESSVSMNHGHRPSLGAIAGAVWLLGALVVIGFALGQGTRPYLLIGRQRFCTDQKTLDILEECKDEMGFRPWLAVIETPLVGSPALFGFVRPRLLLPPGAIESLGPDRLRHVFLHELAHLRRRDIAWNWLATVALAIHWFNPFAWFAVSRLRAEREMACDALVLSRARSTDPAAYGRTLLALAESFSRARKMPGLAGIFENHPQLRRRIAMITGWTRTSVPATALAALLTGCVAVVTLTNARPPASSSTRQAAGTQETSDNRVPDLAVEDLKLEPYQAGGLYQVIATVSNKGDAPVGKFEELFLWSDGQNPESPIAGRGYQSGPFDPGQGQSDVSFPFALREGTNRIRVVLDPDHTIAERNKDNNTATLSVIVKDGKIVEHKTDQPEAESNRSLPDLAIEDLAVEPGEMGGWYRAVVLIRNGSRAPLSGDLDVEFLWSKEEEADLRASEEKPHSTAATASGKTGTSSSPSSGEGESRTKVVLSEGVASIDSPLFALSNGLHRIRVVLDPDNTVKESNEQNNTAWAIVDVKDERVVEKTRYLNGKEGPRIPKGTLATDGSAGSQSYAPLMEIDSATLDDVLAAYGPPENYIWGKQSYPPDNLPARYIALYPKGFSVYIANGKVQELRYEQPGYRFRNKIEVGSPLQDVLDAVGQPKETVVGKANEWKDGVLYRDIDGKKGYDYYSRGDQRVRFFFRNDRVSALYLTRSDFLKGQKALNAAVQGKIVAHYPVVKDCMILKYMPNWRWGNVDNIGVANNDGGVRTLIKWQPVPPDVAGRENLRFLLALYSRKTTATPPEGSVQVLPILADWPERTAWADQPKTETEAASSYPFVARKGWKLFDVTDVVRSAAKNPNVPFHGVELRFDHEEKSSAKNDWSGYAFVSREGADEWAEDRPILLVVQPNAEGSSQSPTSSTLSNQRFAKSPPIQQGASEHEGPLQIRQISKTSHSPAESTNLPDLKMAGFSIEPDSKSTQIIAIATVRNAGGTAAPPTVLKFTREVGNEEEPLNPDDVLRVGPLAPGAEWKLHSEPFTLPEGTSVLNAVVDPFFLLDDNNIANNRATLVVDVKGNRIAHQSTSFPRRVVLGKRGSGTAEISVADDGTARWIQNGKLTVTGKNSRMYVTLPSEPSNPTGCFKIDTATLDDVLAAYGAPEKYIWGNQTFTREKLPTSYILVYPKGFSVYMTNGKVQELRYTEPGYRFRDKVGVGSTLDEVLAAAGAPQKTVFGQPNGFKDQVLYCDIDGKKGDDYYARSDLKVRFFFSNDKVSALYVTRSAEPQPEGASRDPNTRSSKTAPAPSSSSVKPAKSTRLVMFHGSEFPVNDLDLFTASLDDVIRVFGKPQRYEWKGELYDRSKLPPSFQMIYGQGRTEESSLASITMQDGKVTELRRITVGTNGTTSLSVAKIDSEDQCVTTTITTVFPDSSMPPLPNIDTATRADVIAAYGPTEGYLWKGIMYGGGPDHLPPSYIMEYPFGFSVYMANGKVQEIRYTKPGYRFHDKVGIGSSLDKVLATVGTPKETVVGQPNGFKDQVLYRDIDGKKGNDYYRRADQNVRFFFSNDKVSALYVTRSDFQ